MPHIARTVRSILLHYVTMFATVVMLFAQAYGVAQSLKFVPPIYNVPLPTQFLLNGPAGMATDIHGSVYIVDSGHSQIWKVDPTQTTTLFAGNGAVTYAGEGGLAVNASFHRIPQRSKRPPK